MAFKTAVLTKVDPSAQPSSPSSSKTEACVLSKYDGMLSKVSSFGMKQISDGYQQALFRHTNVGSDKQY